MEQTQMIDRKDEPFDEVKRPRHYNVNESGIECVQDSESRVGDVLYCIRWIEDDQCDHVLIREPDSEQWCSIAQAHPDDGIGSCSVLPWVIVGDLVDRHLAREGFRATVTEGPKTDE